MTFQKIMDQLNRGKFANNYLVSGNEYYLETLFLNRLKSVLSQNNPVEDTIIDLNEYEINRLIDEADQYSFFSENRLILINHPTFLSTTSQTKMSDPLIQRLVSYLHHPNPTTVLVWRMGENNLDKRKKLSKAFLKHATLLDLSPLDPKSVISFIKEEIYKRQLKVEESALNELLKRTHFKLTPVVAELNKLNCYAMNGETITLEVIERLVPRQLESDVFELTRVLIERQTQKAAVIFEDLRLQKHEPIALLALIISQFRLFIQVKELVLEGYLEQDIAHALGVHSYRVQLANQTVHRFQLKKLYLYYQTLIDADFQMKTGYLDKETLLYLLIIKTGML